MERKFEIGKNIYFLDIIELHRGREMRSNHVTDSKNSQNTPRLKVFSLTPFIKTIVSFPVFHHLASEISITMRYSFLFL